MADGFFIYVHSFNYYFSKSYAISNCFKMFLDFWNLSLESDPHVENTVLLYLVGHPEDEGVSDRVANGDDQSVDNV